MTDQPQPSSDVRKGGINDTGAELSIVVPMYNEAEVLAAFFAGLVPVLARLGVPYEIVCVNDGSSDETRKRVLAERESNAAIKLVDLSRNFGKESALSAGLSYASGRAVVPIDADLQDPPELIAEFYRLWRSGYEVVFGLRTDRRTDGWLKRTTAAAFYTVFNRLTEVPIPANAGDFRLLDRQVVDIINAMPERSRFMKGIFSWVGFRQVGVPYARQSRRAGTSKWNYWRLWNFALDGLAGYSTAPLRVSSYVGVLTSVLALAYGAFLVAYTFIHGIDAPGYASLMVVVLFIGGIQLTALGIIGEYLGRLYVESKQRPLYIVRDTHGFAVTTNDEGGACGS